MTRQGCRFISKQQQRARSSLSATEVKRWQEPTYNTSSHSRREWFRFHRLRSRERWTLEQFSSHWPPISVLLGLDSPLADKVTSGWKITLRFLQGGKCFVRRRMTTR